MGGKNFKAYGPKWRDIVKRNPSLNRGKKGRKSVVDSNDLDVERNNLSNAESAKFFIEEKKFLYLVRHEEMYLTQINNDVLFHYFIYFPLLEGNTIEKTKEGIFESGSRYTISYGEGRNYILMKSSHEKILNAVKMIKNILVVC